MGSTVVNSTGVSREHLEEAADWHLRLSAENPSCADRLGWQAWYDKSAEHRAAWQRVERLKDLLAQAPTQTTQTLTRPRRVNRRHLLTGLGAIAVGALLYRHLLPAATPVDWVATGPGQRRELALPDGGKLLLGPETRVGIAYGEQQRAIQLAQGALQLQTGQDARKRPLRILARDGQITPLGTRLTLTQDDQSSVVAVQAHAVQVLATDAKFPIRVEAGQRLRFFHGGTDTPGPASFADEAWTRGVLVALEQPLDQFLQALQRQSGVAVFCDPAIAGVRVSGSFLVTDPERSLATLADQQGLRLERRGEVLHLRAR
ncbi:FecR family protein [Roseateles sp. YR242]|uniref:FecR domain-containing protein n=1 Tax=Roseateles sp. YR242 TaxID=1855305 RepID=UPI0008B30BED|nr:FecR domain-containing protein [Roseateles sp. YR242]SEL11095.1 FecR family protein [Roseateles sp. YR242]